ncbi:MULTISPECIES: tRNA lysidine(34) synthetase TilS [unclassified Mycoplasma]|uniref:tRNA lysidine(34) synthetase TilS n=1 Tax=unclassified Mycoplasma TaxID=2683645 RepID=UPI00211B9A57|nr:MULTISPECIES: tRNA lysidine(34) synthetase TilS [unclassified Mycoplasma]UUM19819.1 tRNA lysidine(34) synthetase TilS [Mycoplasma sp. 1578d]UUM24803.1 tRNA lysidine(34) synthetase TilS [Mycoplasma sp. 3686d]
MKLNKKIIIAVSGGPDSMFLLNKYKHKNPIVAFVNYNQRTDSSKDQQIVEEYCEKYHLVLEKLILQKEDYQKGNFQKWARDIRYDFFVEISKKYGINFLLTAHHKDDFLETCLFQTQKQKIVNYWGIKKYSKFKNLNIYRPLIFKLNKKSILKFNIKNNIQFANDYTNEIPKYKRNQIRLELKNKNLLYKEFLITKYRLKNIFLIFKKYSINKQIKIWKNNNYSQETFKFIKKQKQVLYFLINENFDDIKLSNSKLQSIIDFIKSKNRTSVYKLSSVRYLKKIKGKVIFN